VTVTHTVTFQKKEDKTLRNPARNTDYLASL